MQTAMQHPEAERLAALDHDAPTLDELAHLAACSACRAERDAYAALVGMAHAAGRARADGDAPRLTSWDSLSAALRDEGLLTSTTDITPLRTPVVVRALTQRAAMDGTDDDATQDVVTAAGVRQVQGVRRGIRARSFAGPARAAAAIALMASGALLGRVSDGRMGSGDNGESTTAGIVAQQVLSSRDVYASVDDATAALSRAQSEYERASLWLASNDTTTRSSDVYRARLAALDQMMAASKAALRDAPQDPVLNHYFLAAYTAREATLQQLGGALPVDKTIETY